MLLAISRPGSVAPDAPLGQNWLIDQIGRDPVLLAIGMSAPDIAGLRCISLDATPDLQSRYFGTAPSALDLIRPDQIIAARWQSAPAPAIAAALSTLRKDQT